MKTVTVAQAKSHLSALIAELGVGDEVVITRRGKPVARLVPEMPREGFGWAELARWVSAPAAAGIKWRTGALDVDNCREALSNFQRFASTHLRTIEVEPGDFRTTTVLIETPEGSSALRAGDALHLAIARRMRARMASLDRRLCSATDALGLPRFELV